MFKIQFKQKGQDWLDDKNFQPSANREELAIKVLELSKANIGIAFRVLTPPRGK